MDPNFNTYELEEMRRKLAGEDSEEVEQKLREDEARLAGYLKGLSSVQKEAAEAEMRNRLRAPFKK